jgi:redox-sensitive bicupin YhaK (pirin superfamily)
MGPMECAPGEAVGAPDHPHRGFETVTYLLSGAMEHRDSQGNHGKLTPGDVQWMTAGSGVIHSELPEPEFKARGGRMHGFQLWVNLPRRDKMIRPRYQDIPAARIPTTTSEDGKVTARIIAGEAMGNSSVIETHTPISYVHFTIQPGGRVEQAVPADFNGFVYVIDGAGRVSDTHVESGDMAILAPEGDPVVLQAGSGPIDLLLVAGRPLHEPVARYGPFVMNTRDEIVRAVEDFQSGHFGEISAILG